MRFGKRCILLVFALLALSCARKEADAVSSEAARGTLRLHFSSRGEQVSTKAGEMADGSAFRNLLVLIANEGGTLVGKAYKQYDADFTEDVVTFEDLKVGNYEVYAYANIYHTAWQTTGATVEEVEKALVTGNSVAADRTLKTLDGTAAPGTPSEAMLLTGHKKLAVGSYENIGEVELLRPVCRLNVLLYNHTPFDVDLISLSFSAFNPSDTYLLDHRDASGVPQLPAGSSYRMLPAATVPQTVPAQDASDSESGYRVYSQLLYENAAGEYRLFAGITLDPDGDKRQSAYVTDGNTWPLTPDFVRSMQVEDTRIVLLVNPNYRNNNDGGVFYADGTSIKKLALPYSREEDFRNRIRELVSDANSRDKYLFTLKRISDDASTGLPLYSLTNKVNNVNVLKALTKDGAFLEDGEVPSSGADYPISADFKGRLFRFRTDAWNHKDYLRNYSNAAGYNWVESNNNNDATYYHNNHPGRQYVDEGIFQWALYDTDGGAGLKVVDNVTSQVSPLSYMRRNQELNVVLNVFYQQEYKHVNFVVDNAWWTTGHTMEHVFE